MCEEGEGKRKGPSIQTLSWGAAISVLSLLASGVASYTNAMNEIASLKRGEVYQERVNERLEKKIDNNGLEQRESMKEFNDKLDRIIYHWSGKK